MITVERSVLSHAILFDTVGDRKQGYNTALMTPNMMIVIGPTFKTKREARARTKQWMAMWKKLDFSDWAHWLLSKYRPVVGDDSWMGDKIDAPR